eukprot:sb/3470190/
MTCSFIKHLTAVVTCVDTDSKAPDRSKFTPLVGPHDMMRRVLTPSLSLSLTLSHSLSFSLYICDLQLWLMQLWLIESMSHRCIQLWLIDSMSHSCMSHSCRSPIWCYIIFNLREIESTHRKWVSSRTNIEGEGERVRESEREGERRNSMSHSCMSHSCRRCTKSDRCYRTMNYQGGKAYGQKLARQEQDLDDINKQFLASGTYDDVGVKC